MILPISGSPLGSYIFLLKTFQKTKEKIFLEYKTLQVLYAMRLVSTFVYLKIRKFENPGLYPMERVGTVSSVQDPHYHENSHNPSTYLHNPNYEQNLLSHYPAEQESLYSESRSAGLFQV